MHEDLNRVDTGAAAVSALAGDRPSASVLTLGLRQQAESSLLADQVFEVLRGWISRGDWQPGKQLRIRQVASLVGTSETPVREAFRRLAEAGLIVIEPYKGATVRVLRIDDLERIYDVRIMLEPEAGRQGAVDADAEVVETMRRHWQLLGSASARGDIVTAVAEDEHLLNALYGAGQNQVLTRRPRPVGHVPPLQEPVGDQRGRAGSLHVGPRAFADRCRGPQRRSGGVRHPREDLPGRPSHAQAAPR